eukprot:TRINITY_DN11758_c0_g1_i1.p1 TRINITY_DN11758_c0_g1~~TRINITY_DN11758_c0_g1_i1.p1  ORF type:complete len:177 (+),score=32.72 TRINITY_DN11758_c0_g1_i1:68-598(+)
MPWDIAVADAFGAMCSWKSLGLHAFPDTAESAIQWNMHHGPRGCRGGAAVVVSAPTTTFAPNGSPIDGFTRGFAPTAFAARAAAPKPVDFLGAAQRLNTSAEFLRAMGEGRGWQATKDLLTDKAVVETLGNSFTDIRNDCNDVVSDIARTKHLLTKTLAPSEDAPDLEDEVGVANE